LVRPVKKFLIAILLIAIAVPVWAEGTGLKNQDSAEEMLCLEKAANQGHIEAQYRLGVLYTDSWGVHYSLVDTYKWANIAAAQGHKKAIQLRKYAKKYMSAEEIHKAQKLSRDWFKKQK